MALNAWKSSGTTIEVYASCNASAAKIYNATRSLVRFENNNISSILGKKTLAVNSSYEIRIRSIGSW
jgi:hypothetical protein